MLALRAGEGPRSSREARSVLVGPGPRQQFIESIPIQMAVLGCLYVGIATMVHATIVVMAVQLKPLLIDGSEGT
jgi:hypothetical protein